MELVVLILDIIIIRQSEITLATDLKNRIDHCYQACRIQCQTNNCKIWHIPGYIMLYRKNYNVMPNEKQSVLLKGEKLRWCGTHLTAKNTMARCAFRKRDAIVWGIWLD